MVSPLIFRLKLVYIPWEQTGWARVMISEPPYKWLLDLRLSLLPLLQLSIDLVPFHIHLNLIQLCHVIVRSCAHPFTELAEWGPSEPSNHVIISIFNCHPLIMSAYTGIYVPIHKFVYSISVWLYVTGNMIDMRSCSIMFICGTDIDNHFCQDFPNLCRNFFTLSQADRRNSMFLEDLKLLTYSTTSIVYCQHNINATEPLSSCSFIIIIIMVSPRLGRSGADGWRGSGSISMGATSKSSCDATGKNHPVQIDKTSQTFRPGVPTWFGNTYHKWQQMVSERTQGTIEEQVEFDPDKPVSSKDSCRELLKRWSTRKKSTQNTRPWSVSPRGLHQNRPQQWWPSMQDDKTSSPAPRQHIRSSFTCL